MPQRSTSRLHQAYAAVRGSTLQAAADVARGVHASGGPPPAKPSPAEVRGLKRREAAALLTWARSNGLLLDDAEFTRDWIAQGSIGGQENDVFLRDGRVLKRNNLCFHLSYADFFDRLALHHLLFPGAPLSLEGFVQHDAELLPIMSQPAVRAQRGAKRTEVATLMRQLGFEPVRNDDYRHPEGILVEDLHDENVFIDTEGEIVLIDPVIYLEGARPVTKTTSSRSRHPSRRSLLPGKEK
jgi:hypothetical protein